MEGWVYIMQGVCRSKQGQFKTFEDHDGLNLRTYTKYIKKENDKENPRPRITFKVTKCFVIYQATHYILGVGSTSEE